MATGQSSLSEAVKNPEGTNLRKVNVISCAFNFDSEGEDCFLSSLKRYTELK